jgi:antitoxin ParD1/3/4
MNISLTPELEQFVEARVKGGLYHSASEVIREGLRLLAERDELKNKRLQMLNLEIDLGLASLQAGRPYTGQAAYDELVARRGTYGR